MNGPNRAEEIQACVRGLESETLIKEKHKRMTDYMGELPHSN
jgi:hypothetical protein